MATKEKTKSPVGAPRDTPGNPEILTVGHSTRPIGHFIALLHSHSVTLIADVRTIPRSRRNPQFSTESLSSSLKSAGIDYVHLPALGGLRHPARDSINTGWRNASFRGYADYMQTPQFGSAVQDLIRLASKTRVAIMCAEAVPWRCHRSLIADALLVRGYVVEHILSPTSRRPHTLTPFARIEGFQVTYPPPIRV